MAARYAEAPTWPGAAAGSAGGGAPSVLGTGRPATPETRVGGSCHAVSVNELTDEQKAILDFERAWWKFAGAKEGAIREHFGCSATVYYARLNRLIDRPEALAAEPMVVRRLLRLREDRKAARTA